MMPPDKLTNPLASGWWTSEFGAMLVAIFVDLAATVVTVILIQPSMGLTPQQRIEAVGILFGVITGTTITSRSFMLGRVDVKTKAIENPEATIKLMEAAKAQENYPPWVKPQ